MNKLFSSIFNLITKSPPSLTMSLLLQKLWQHPDLFMVPMENFWSQELLRWSKRDKTSQLKNTMKHLITFKDLTGNMDFLEISVEQDNSDVYSEF